MMTIEILNALELPKSARVDRRVAKTLLLEHGAPMAADKRKINEGIEWVKWVAALKPTTVGVAEYRDDEREYLEVAVLHLHLREAAKSRRLIELLHRAVPYPVVAITEKGAGANLSLAHKRWSQGETGKTVLDDDVVAVEWSEVDEPNRSAFLAALALGRQPHSDLLALYQGWIDTLLALLAARRTNTFAIPDTADRLQARREALRECKRLEDEITRLRTAAAREKQIPKQVELNLELKRVKADHAAAQEKL